MNGFRAATVAQVMAKMAKEIEAWLLDHSPSISDTSVVAKAEAETLVLFATGWSRLELISQLSSPMAPDDEAALRAAVARRLQGEPLQYIIGEAPFYGRLFVVRPGCLIPRPETEVLVELAAAWTNQHCPHALIFDLGSGSGCLSLTLALECKGAKVTSVDVSASALEIARENAERVGLVAEAVGGVAVANTEGVCSVVCSVANASGVQAQGPDAQGASAGQKVARPGDRVRFIEADGLQMLRGMATTGPRAMDAPNAPQSHALGAPGAAQEPTQGAPQAAGDLQRDNLLINVLVSNPPYVPTADVDGLSAEVREYEPKLALDGGEDGLCFYREIANIGPGYFQPGPAACFFEIGAGQGESVLALFQENPAWDGWTFASHADLNGITRVIQGTR